MSIKERFDCVEVGIVTVDGLFSWVIFENNPHYLFIASIINKSGNGKNYAN
jgi:hypothetical protein